RGPRWKQRNRKAAGDRDDQRHAEELFHAAVRGEKPEDEQRPRIPFDVIPGEVQERRREDLRQPPDVARQDAVVVVEPVVADPGEDLEHPDQRDEADHEEESLPRLVNIELRGPHRTALTPPGLTAHAHIVYPLWHDATSSKRIRRS